MLVGAITGVRAQSLRTRYWTVNSDTLAADTLPVIPHSVVVFSKGVLIENGMRYYAPRNCFIVDTQKLKGEIKIYYRVLQLNIKSTYSNKNPLMIEPTATPRPEDFYDYRANTGNLLFGNSGLNVNGNIARGLGFGNNQDVVVNSNLNLQMSGNLGRGISILAAISDENNPIQPDGNTQQIQDFDKVYITLQKDSNALTVGDVLMRSNTGNYFMKYNKKSRGVQFDMRSGDKLRYHMHADAAVSRGRFVRNEIQGVEGNQGPYRLSGANNELNIIIISGTEVVYVDGERMSRGQQNDYVIDYNTGELTFMPRKLITQYSRIVVEFQYSDRNYARSVIQTGHDIKKGKWLHSFQYFSEQDNRQQPTDTANRNSVVKLLEDAGDSKALYQNIKTYTVFQNDRIMYRKRDSLGYKIFVYAAEASNDSFYTLSFSLVGQGKGNYVSVASAANGRVYAWVEPLNGQPQGNYEPYIELVAPNRMQMFTASSTLQVNKKTTVKVEGAYSGFDKNTYSTLDKKDDDGVAAFASFNQKGVKIRNFVFDNELKLEFANKNFRYVERYRAVEFDRVWNRQLSNNGNQKAGLNELIGNLKSAVTYREKTRLTMELSNYNRDKFFNGYRGNSELAYTGKRLLLNGQAELQNTVNTTTGVKLTNDYSRFKGGVGYSFKKIKIGTDASSEKSTFTTDTTGNFATGTYSFNQLSAYLQSQNTLRWRYKVEGSTRVDFLPDKARMVKSAEAYNATSGLEYNSVKNNRLNITANYRHIKNISSPTPEQTILNRIEHSASFFKRVLSTTTYYQIGTGREQKRQFTFTLVQPGQGNYTWVDYNGNGKEELNEFEQAVYTDQARYVKVYIPTNEFIRSNTNEFNQTIRLQAPQGWNNKRWFKRSLSRFNTITSYKADRKITDNRFSTIINPFKLDVADTSLISVSSLIKQTTFFNRTNAKFGIEHTIQTGRNKTFLNSGFEWRRLDKQSMTLRYSFSKALNIVNAVEIQTKTNTNQFFANRNYNYSTRSVFPELFYQHIKGFRMGLFYKYLEAANAKDLGGEEAYIAEVGTEFRYFVVNKGNIDARLVYHSINYKGNANSPLAFDLLNGLSNGDNITWNLGFGGKMAGNIQINLTYEGRKTQTFKTIHIGRAEARYIF